MNRIIVCIAACALVAGCGKPPAGEYFARAQQAERKAAAIADSLRSPDEVREAFQPALELFETVRREYPADSLAGTALFEIANIRNGALHAPGAAIDAYRQYTIEYPGGPQAPLAMFMIGYLYNNELHNTDSAAAAYRRFLARFPDNEMAASARFELGTLGKSPEEALPVPSPAAASKHARTRPPA